MISIRYAEKIIYIKNETFYTQNGFSNTVTVFLIPEGVTAVAILDSLRIEHHIMLAGSFDVMAGEVIRIGHMGYNCTEENMRETL